MSDIALFHIGMPRCGSTFLQKGVFPQHKDEILFSEDLTGWTAAVTALMDPSHSTQDLKAMAEKMPSRPPDQPLLISSEGYSANALRLKFEMPERIAAICPDAHIAVVLREQIALIESMYTYLYIKPDGTLRFPQYLNRLIESDHLNYTRLIRAYHEAFGKTRVHVFFFDDLKCSDETFAKRFLALMGVDTETDIEQARRWRNSRYGNGSVRVLSILNRIRRIPGFRQFHTRLGWARRICRVLRTLRIEIDKPFFESQPTLRERMHAHYAPLNHKLAALLDIELPAGWSRTG